MGFLRSITVNMITIIVTLTFMISPCLSIHCVKEVCYGTMQELQERPIQQDSIVYFVQPSHYNAPCPLNDCISLLRAGSKLDCKGNVSSHTEDTWTIPRGVKLYPSCTMEQTLIREGSPSEDVLDTISLARVVIDDRKSPCSVLKIEDSQVEVSNFVLNNSECVSHMSDSMRETYLSSVVNVYPKKRNLSDISLTSLYTLGGKISIHMGSLSELFPILTLSNVDIYNIEGGQLSTEMICGDIKVQNVSGWILQDIPSYLCSKSDKQNDNITDSGVMYPTSKVSDSMGPLQLIHFYSSVSAGSQPNGNCMRCYLLLVIFIILFFIVTTVSCLCYFMAHSHVGSMVESGHLRKDVMENVSSKKRHHL